uniref:Uncharacterized protein n=1 Tax=viral metagenome TaxID=1070528 RepID=A0A6C0B4J8_9ZZZZ
MNETTYLILQCGAPFLYKPAYFRVPNRMTPNTYNFIVMQNKTNNGCIGLTKNMTKDKMKNSVKLNGQGPIDYSILSKRRRRCIIKPLCEWSSDSDDDLY